MSREITFIEQKKLVPNDIIRADIESKTFDYNIDILKASIEVQGVLTPLLVSHSDGKYLIVDGNRRFAAGSKAGLKEFPCVVVEEYKSDNLAKITEVGFSANELRQDLTPSQEIEALKRVCEKGELTLEQIAEATGKTIDQLWDISRRTKLDKKIVEMMDKGEISKSATNRLTSLSSSEQLDVVTTFKSLGIPVTQSSVRLYRGHSIKNRGISPKIVRKLQENIGLHAEELDKLKKHYRNLQKELVVAHELARKIWRVPELHDYIKDHYPEIYQDFRKVLVVLGH